MCDPATAAMAMTAFSTYQQGQHASKVASYNARVAANEAEDARRVGTEKEMDMRQRTARLVSRQRAQLGAAGVNLDSGSAAALQESAALQGEVDALRIRGNTEARVRGSQVESQLLSAEADARANAATVGALGSAAQIGYGWSRKDTPTGRSRLYADKWYTNGGTGAAAAYPVG